MTGPGRIAVAGCGPAGLAVAILLRRQGRDVAIYERFAAPQPVGSGLMLQPTGLAVLRAMGLEAGLLGKGARIARLFGRAAPSGRIVLDVRYDALGPGLFGLAVHRAALFEALHAAALASGATIHAGRAVAAAPLRPDGRRDLAFADGDRAGPFDLVIDALGARSTLAPPTGRDLPYGALWASLDWPEGGPFAGDALEQRYVRAVRMAGVLPIGLAPARERPQAAYFWSLRADALADWRAAGLARWKDEARALWPQTASLLDEIVAPEQLVFARYAHRTLAAPAEPALMHVGDAWRSTSPQLGQGANMALLDAVALALALADTPAGRDPLERAVALRRRHVLLYQGMSRLFTPFYQSDGRTLPFIRDALAGPLSRIPPFPRLLAAMVAGGVGGPLRGLGLTKADEAP
ncbi:MAG: FAD-dependent monooxygenase [Rhizobiales bacterium]|nr:FAD-dependent monooxygenase [Hyphomicrobiales bacterium]